MQMGRGHAGRDTQKQELPLGKGLQEHLEGTPVGDGGPDAGGVLQGMGKGG